MGKASLASVNGGSENPDTGARNQRMVSPGAMDGSTLKVAHRSGHRTP